MKRQWRTEVIHVRVTKQELADMEARAVKHGYASLSDYIRNVIRIVTLQVKATERQI